jgi:hypothetical protein
MKAELGTRHSCRAVRLAKAGCTEKTRLGTSQYKSVQVNITTEDYFRAELAAPARLDA